jgi:vancomycin resistance protein VanJ
MKIQLPGKRHAWLAGLILAYGVFLALLTALNGFGADRWGPGAFNLYLPQALWLAPVLLLTILSFRLAKRWIWVLAIFIIWVCGPIMGFCWRRNSQPEPVGVGPTLRVMTCNIKYGHRDISPLIRDIVRYSPDVVFFQDAEHAMSGPLAAHFQGWDVHSSGQYVIASRWPLGKAEGLSISSPNHQIYFLRTMLQFGNTPISLYDVHLLTPRDGLNAMRVARKQPGRFAEAVEDLQDNVDHRLLQARAVADYARLEPGAVILAGDLNSPDGSMACRMLRDANLRDAFVEGGRGYGYTYGHFLLRGRMPWLPSVSWMRIDHIMLSPGLRTLRCWTGNGEASDHRPVIADLIVKAP